MIMQWVTYLYDAITDWLFSSRVGGFIDRVFVAYFDAVWTDGNGNQHPICCGICTAIRSILITLFVVLLLWWFL
jgi:hypothetical protein